MKNKILTSTRTDRRRPALSFLLSLLVTGLGQAYNGELARGAAFLALRCIIILIPSISILTGERRSYLVIFTVMLAFTLLLSLLSAAEGAWFAAGEGRIRLRRYNSLFGYILYTAGAAALTGFALMVAVSFFSTRTITAENPGPVLKQGDTVLTARLNPGSYRPGDLVIHDGEVGRIIAEGGDTAEYRDSNFWVNGRALPLTVFNDRQMERLGLPVNADVLGERIDDIRYPVTAPEETGRMYLRFRVPEGSYLVARDDRSSRDFAETTDKNRIAGRIEGVIWSSFLSRILLKPCIRNILLDETGTVDFP